MKRTHLFHHEGHYVAGIGSFRASNPEYEDVTRDEIHTLKAILHGEWIGSAPSPADLCAKGTEHGEQVALLAVLAAFKRMVADDMPQAVRDFAQVADMVYAVPNGGQRDSDRLAAQRTGSMMKAEGVKSGIPDLIFDCPVWITEEKRARFNMTQPWGMMNNIFCGLRIEMKRKDGGEGMSDNQLKWQAKMRAKGYVVEQANGWREAVPIIAAYAGLSMP